VIVHVLVEYAHLLCNRHLDQIIMCSIYGVCRVAQQSGEATHVRVKKFKLFVDTIVVSDTIQSNLSGINDKLPEDIRSVQNSTTIQFKSNQSFLILDFVIDVSELRRSTEKSISMQIGARTLSSSTIKSTFQLLKTSYCKLTGKCKLSSLDGCMAILSNDKGMKGGA